MPKTICRFLLCITILAVAACGGGEEDFTAEQSAYAAAQKHLRVKNFRGAIEVYKILESRFPFGRFSQQAQLENIYAHYMSGQGEGAIAAADRFIELYPDHDKVDYAFYLRGLASFTESHTPMRLFFLRDLSDRDPESSRRSFRYFHDLVRLFPTSQYAQDARQRMVYLRNLLSHREVEIGYYYLARKAYAAAANRGRYVVENFSRTPAVIDALVLMIDSYLHMNLEELAADAIRVLRENEPDHPNLGADDAYYSRTSPKRADHGLDLPPTRPDVPPPTVIQPEGGGKEEEESQDAN